jgi:ATP-dependent helicase HrpB
VDRAAQQFIGICRRLQLPVNGPDRTDDLIKCVLTAFRDHLAMKIERDRPNCAMVGRRKVLLDRESVLSGRDAGLFVALDVREIGTGDKAQTMLSLASHVETAWLEEADAAGLATRHQLEWNHAAKAVEAIEQRTYRGLTLQQTSRPPTSPSDLDAAATMIVDRIITGELTLDHWNDKVEQWITRARSVARWFPERGLIAYDDDDIRVILHEIVGKSSRFSQVRDKPCLDFVRGALSWDDQQFIERMAPESIPLPRGWRMKVEYAMDGPPKARVKIQDLYDLDDTPRIAAGRQPVLLEILGPNFRPVQVTSDLRGFWQNLYPELKKELKRRYPRHEWR